MWLQAPRSRLFLESWERMATTGPERRSPRNEDRTSTSKVDSEGFDCAAKPVPAVSGWLSSAAASRGADGGESSTKNLRFFFGRCSSSTSFMVFSKRSGSEKCCGMIDGWVGANRDACLSGDVQNAKTRDSVKIER